MRYSYIIRIAYKSLAAKRARTFVTIGGIVIGVGAIVFLVSLGYGLQNLVTDQVTDLQALRLAEVRSEKSSVLKIGDEQLTTLQALPNVKEVVPIVSIAGRASINNANTDIVIFGAPTRYMTLNNVSPRGTIFRNGDGTKPVNEIVVNAALANVLGLGEGDAALGKSIALDYILTSSVAPAVPDTESRAAGNFTVVGVLEDKTSPLAYIPLSELVAQGVQFYEQATIRVENDEDLGPVRQSIEALGYQTSSAADTVTQINSVFSVFRIILAAVGAIALIIAALGMFNTLTVSLLERTRELGFMKALGTQNRDVYALFLTESLIISSTGGVIGILTGYFFGELVNYVLNVAASASGNPPVDIFITPYQFSLIILAFSFIVGIFTGLYPSRRAARINPLDALRYE